MKTSVNVCKELHDIRNKQYFKGITLVTPTRDRHIAFERCEFYIRQQTLQPYQWLVIDDGLQKVKCTLGQDHIKRPYSASAGKAKSLTGNILEALNHIRYDKILIIEDDDCYLPSYIERMVFRLSGKYDLVGESPAIYYNVAQRKYRVQGNHHRASFCQTAFKANVLEAVFICCQKRDSSFIDSRLWAKTSIRKAIFSDVINCIGIKGMPGYLGIGSGHRPGKNYKTDSSLTFLKKYLPQDWVDFYAAFSRSKN